jgi:hypothetical protein
MPGANGPYLFAKFFEGYRQGQQQTQIERMQKAQNFMQIAQMRAKDIDEAKTEEGRAMAWKHAQEAMDEVEKALKPEKSTWSMIKGMFGKGKKDDMQDPHKLLGITGDMASGAGPAPMPQPGGQEQSVTPNSVGRPDTTPGLPPPPQGEPQITAPGNDPSQLDSLGNVIGAPPPQQIERPDGVPGRPALAPSVVGGMAGAEPQRTVPPPPVSAVKALTANDQVRAMTEEYKKSWGAPLESGQVISSQAKGKGLEMVRVAPGETQFQANGQPISYGEYKEYRKALLTEQFKSEFRKGETKEKLAEDMELFKQKLDQQEQALAKSAEAYKAWATSPDAATLGVKFDPDIYTEIRTGVKHQQPRTDDRLWQDESGVRWKEVIDINTGKTFPGTRVQIPPTMDDEKTLMYQRTNKNKDGSPLTWAQAQDMRYKNDMADENLKDQMRRAQKENIELTMKNKRELSAIRDRKDKLGKADIQKAMTLLAPIARSAATAPVYLPDGTVNPNGGKFDLSSFNATLHQLMTTELGLGWDQVIKAYGGDPLAIASNLNVQARQYAEGATGSGQTGTPAYQPRR